MIPRPFQVSAELSVNLSLLVFYSPGTSACSSQHHPHRHVATTTNHHNQYQHIPIPILDANDRWKTDIYSDPVLPGRKLKVAEDNQTKAAYEVSRIAHIARDKLVAAKDQMAKEAGSSSDSSDSG